MELEYEDIDLDGSPFQKKQDMRINAEEAALIKLKELGMYDYAMRILDGCKRKKWISVAERNKFCAGMRRNAKRPYGKEFAEWLIYCIDTYGIQKGWTLERIIGYLNGDKYTEKLPLLMKQRGSNNLPIEKNGKQVDRLPIASYLEDI